jgi:hypothetical protein
MILLRSLLQADNAYAVQSNSVTLVHGLLLLQEYARTHTRTRTHTHKVVLRAD